MRNFKTPVPQYYPWPSLLAEATRPESTPTPMIPPPPRGRSFDVQRPDSASETQEVATAADLNAPDDGWVDLDVDALFDSIRVADAMVLEAEMDPESGEDVPSTRRSRIAQVAARCNGGES